jgi:NAD/NADP transhydrogenase beta subunit
VELIEFPPYKCHYYTHDILKFLSVGIGMSKSETVRQLFSLLWEKKLWWMIPMVSVFLLLGVLLVIAQGSALSPFVYPLF